MAPNILERAYVLRPTPGFASPHLCTLHELRTVYTIDDLADFHEALDLQDAATEKAMRHAEQERERERQRGRRRR